MNDKLIPSNDCYGGDKTELQMAGKIFLLGILLLPNQWRNITPINL
jgi:hypothetical protein